MSPPLEAQRLTIRCSPTGCTASEGEGEREASPEDAATPFARCLGKGAQSALAWSFAVVVSGLANDQRKKSELTTTLTARLKSAALELGFSTSPTSKVAKKTDGQGAVTRTYTPTVRLIVLIHDDVTTCNATARMM